jgi:hypothetical protein
MPSEDTPLPQKHNPTMDRIRINVSVQGIVYHPLKNQTLRKTDSTNFNKCLPVTVCFYSGGVPP